MVKSEIKSTKRKIHISFQLKLNCVVMLFNKSSDGNELFRQIFMGAEGSVSHMWGLICVSHRLLWCDSLILPELPGHSVQIYGPKRAHTFKQEFVSRKTFIFPQVISPA